MGCTSSGVMLNMSGLYWTVTNDEIPIPTKAIGKPAIRPRIFSDFRSFLYSTKVSFSPSTTSVEYSRVDNKHDVGFVTTGVAQADLLRVEDRQKRMRERGAEDEYFPTNRIDCPL